MLDKLKQDLCLERDRVCKYNQLLRINESEVDSIQYFGKKLLNE